MKASHAALALGLLALPIVACSFEEEPSTESSEDELRALTAAEIVGTIAYGETKTITYASTPRYRALSFEAQKGDQIDVRFVGSSALDPVGYLLSSSFATIARNDDESATSKASHLTRSISKAGTYYLAVTDLKSRSGDVTISLTRVGGTPPVQPPTPPSSNDPFDPASCTGAPIMPGELMAMIDPSRGVLGKKVGRFAIHRRSRACYAGVPCSAWRAGADEITAPFPTLNATFSTSTLQPRFQVNLVGDVSVELAANTLRVNLDGDLQTASWGGSFTPDYLKNALNVGILAPSAVATTANVIVKYTWMPSLGCPNGHCQGNSSIPGTSNATWAGKSPLGLTGKVTSSCLRLASSATQNTVDGSGNSYRLESDLVVAGNFASATCRATTCAEKGSTCGTIDNGCGGTLACGTCGSGMICQSATTGNSCRGMDPIEMCGAQGKVYCPGRGCYDACF